MGLLDGPHSYALTGELSWNDEIIGVNPALRFGVQQGEQRLAVDGLEASETKRALALHTPINLLSWGHIIHLCENFRGQGIRGSFGMAKADPADAYK